MKIKTANNPSGDHVIVWQEYMGILLMSVKNTVSAVGGASLAKDHSLFIVG
jgi:hypothetical protein